MKSIFKRVSILSIAIFFISAIQAQDEWPKIITASDGTVIKIYQPTPESFAGTVFKFRSAISLQASGQDEPVFGTFWSVANVETDKDTRRINLLSLKVPNLKLAADTDANRINYLKTTLETQIPNSGYSLPLDQVLSSLEMNTEEKKLSKGLNNTPPKVIYATKPSILVLIDGTPKLQHNSDWGVDAVVNSPFTIVKNSDGSFYLYGGKKWYTAPSATGPYLYTPNVPDNLKKVEAAVTTANSSTDAGYTSDAAAAQTNDISDIIVSTEPAELIQSKGPANFSPIDGTDLLYMSNSDNDVFMDTNTQQYYLLISGRWYKSSQLNGGWQYTAANTLPADFAKIPEGSTKDNVLASVAGTDAAREAVMDAQIPQTAKVDRKTANTNVTYDGEPQFKNIDGTSMQYAVNTPGSVIRYKNMYYTVDNGVWFESNSPTGPWTVATQRPDEIDIIPPSYPVYNMKYVYIYDVNPDYVYMGYTPGYLNTFIYGPTVVYGTGFYYNPWRGAHYYARPYTWGFGMNYNPWLGWSIGLGYSYDWFNFGFGISSWGYGWGGGWWGPAVYHPPYRWNSGRAYGYYGRNGLYNTRMLGNYTNRGVRVTVNNHFTNNIYHYRNDVITNRARVANNSTMPNNINRGGAPGQRGVDANNGNSPLINRGGSFRSPGTTASPQQEAGRPAQSNPRVLSDQQGNVYQRSNEGQWQQRQQNQWKPVAPAQKPEVLQNLNHQQQMMDRGQVRTQNFQSIRQQPSAPARSSGGGGRPSSGGGRGGGRRG
jgi:hypothetical protein